MSDAISWVVLNVIEARIRQITTPNGYFTNLGAGIVTTNPESLSEEPTVPYTIVVGSDFEEQAAGRNVSRCLMDVVIEFKVPFGTDAEQQAERLAHNARADLVRAMRGVERGSVAGFTSFDIQSSRIGPPDDGASVVVAQVTARAGLSETNSPAN